MKSENNAAQRPESRCQVTAFNHCRGRCREPYSSDGCRWSESLSWVRKLSICSCKATFNSEANTATSSSLELASKRLHKLLMRLSDPTLEASPGVGVRIPVLLQAVDRVFLVEDSTSQGEFRLCRESLTGCDDLFNVALRLVLG